MIYHSVAEIFDSIEATRRKLNERLAELNTEQENFRAPAGGWSIAEIAEHLALLEEGLLKLMTMMVKKAESAGAQRALDAAFVPVTLDQFAERSVKEKFNAPESVRPSGQVSVRDALARLRQSRAALNELRPSFEALDLTTARYPHPAFGPLDLYQWLVMIGAHEERHLRQIEALMSSQEYKTATTGA